jgi:hypothetical protein
MTEQIVIAVITIVGIAFLINGILAFNKGESQVYFGRREKKLITFTGMAGDTIAIMCVLAGLVAVIASTAFWMGLAPFYIVFLVVAISLILYQGVSFLNLFVSVSWMSHDVAASMLFNGRYHRIHLQGRSQPNHHLHKRFQISINGRYCLRPFIGGGLLKEDGSSL